MHGTVRRAGAALTVGVLAVGVMLVAGVVLAAAASVTETFESTGRPEGFVVADTPRFTG